MKRVLHTAKLTTYVLKETFSEFMHYRGMKLSAALSYYTIFSLPPLLIIIYKSVRNILWGLCRAGRNIWADKRTGL